MAYKELPVWRPPIPVLYHTVLQDFNFPNFVYFYNVLYRVMLEFPQQFLSSEERCALHFMLSSSFDTCQGDENNVCSNLAQYRSHRLPRTLNSPQQRPSNFIGDVEILDSLQAKNTVIVGPRRNGYQNVPQIATVNVDNRWAATLAGDLAEVALVQVPVSNNEQATVGASGAWNSTVMPKWYFLSQRQNLEMTDAEIRGSIDGLILALNIDQWRNQVSNLKLSQLLPSFSGPDIGLCSGIRSRNALAATLSPDSIANFSLVATNALINYLRYYTIHQCPPLYVSVQAPSTSSSSSNNGYGGSSYASICSDAACQTPDQYRYTVSVAREDLFSLSYDLPVETAAERLVKRIRKVCTSALNPWPYRNPTSPYTQGVDCKQITTRDFSFDLGDLCLSYDHFRDCPSLYLSVQAQSFAAISQLDCKEAACSTPHEARFSIMVII
ncbi:hypothetical protein EVAR_71376_1 [Eumeta japonica]|uniref:Uncharacterized protein n=1 Tax=Eumeta variegata TaxID=151549 RepID=A0A4C2ADR6_EUMVA|nr:hypothetical protein EVAR_71376_1 [Eumeta japonica]